MKKVILKESKESVFLKDTIYCLHNNSLYVIMRDYRNSGQNYVNILTGTCFYVDRMSFEGLLERLIKFSKLYLVQDKQDIKELLTML